MTVVRRSSVSCWIEGLKEFVKTKGEDVPLKTARFEYYLERWIHETDAGQAAMNMQQFVFAGNKMLMSKIKF
mgnify:CR=1 FL=1